MCQIRCNYLYAYDLSRIIRLSYGKTHSGKKLSCKTWQKDFSQAKFFRKHECVLLRIQWFSMELPTHCKATTVIHKKFPSLFCYTSNLPFVYWWKLFTSKLWPAKIVAIILCHHKNPNYDRRWPITITCEGSYHLLQRKVWNVNNYRVIEK